MEHKNRDCRNYAPIDVIKGMCHAKKEIVFADADACDQFERLPKCKHCHHYVAGPEEYIGTCNASPTTPMAYSDLISVTCEHFAWNEV